ncbi:MULTISPECIES: outer membrane protein assembly factor BamB [Halomonadaceae]|uniref:outer membrane protein assembly factor BamB n=1 Tax=Halomonadaceae TaxID=28256 RepID=UPI001582D66C|nr:MULTISPECIES: outer membrane protein assembly factor BamB [Halomonas]MDI4638570.1 outer membrane protein assembly factor BamB [Halomonas sp. BMC7]NUJ59556.1 outer membrane protein assembly factor BamB [Halomonas taeanensis]
MKSTLLIALASLGLLAGCAGQVEPETPPKELTNFSESVTLDGVWSVQVGDGLGEARYPISPSLDGDTLFAADAEGELMAINAESGERRWTVELDNPVSSGLTAVAERLYLGTRNGEVLAIDQADGKVLWRSRVPSEVLAAPQPNQRLLVVQSVDGSVTALERDSGAEQWVYTTSAPALTLRGTGTPRVIEPVTFAGFANGRVATIDNRSGQALWEQRIAVPQGRSEVDRLIDLDGEPLLTRDGRLYLTSYHGRLVAMEAQSGETLWERDISSYLSPLLVGDTLYVIDDASHVLALDALSGQIKWRSNVLEGRQLTAPAFADGKLVLGDFEGYVHLLDATDGHLAGREHIDSSGISLRPLTDGRRIHALANDGRLEALEIRELP